MKYKIERVPPPTVGHRSRDDFRAFVLALKALKVGDSFLRPGKDASNRRMAISIVQILMGVQIATRAEGDGLRIWRIA